MRLKGAFLRTRVARRVLALFALCAMVPIGALALISYIYVSNQLESQSRNRLRQASKLASDGLLERLYFLETGLTTVSVTLSERSSTVKASLDGRVRSLTLQHRDGTTRALVGPLISVPELSAVQEEHLALGRAVLALHNASDQVSILLARSAETHDGGRSILWAEIEPAYLWRIGDEDVAGLLPDTELCVFDASDSPIYCSVPAASPIVAALRQRRAAAQNGDAGEHRRAFEWNDPDNGESYLAAYRLVFLRHAYSGPDWTVVVSESKANVLRPMASFKRTFPFVMLLALWFVLLLSNLQIRKSMDPLVQLQSGTKRIAAKDFETPVKVTSGDEFEDLAASFNAMAHRLGKQFSALNAINEIDRAVLSARETDQIIDTVLSRTSSVLACDAVSICLEQPNSAGAAWRMVAVDVTEDQKLVQDVGLTSEEADELSNHPDHVMMDGRSTKHTYLDIPTFALRGIESFLVLPMFRHGALSGVISLGYVAMPELGEEDLVQARQLADQVAVALSNAHLIEELHQLSWGTLKALARTIDAKSPWTAGHSERVTEMAMAIARELDLDDEQLDILHRGGLLHDIGKIGVPASVLNKAGPLDEDEWELIKRHPEIGARILSPIAAFGDVLPIVSYHHEKLDGTGYPEGLAGDDIPYLARVLAVADVWDALTSDRPYRSGMTHAKTIGIIEQDSGTHFDPVVVQAFLAVTLETTPAGTQPEALFSGARVG